MNAAGDNTPGDEARHRALRESLGAYVLDQLSAAERTAVEAHLDGCPACRAEVAEIAPVAEPLGRVDPARLTDTPTPPPWLGDRIVERARGERRRSADRRSRPRRGVLVGAAAAVMAGLVGAGIGFAAGQDPDVPREPVTVQAVDSAIEADATVIPHTWGVEITLTADGFEPGAVYRVVVTDEGGRVVNAGQFLGTGAQPMVCNLNSSVLRADVTGFDVLDAEGQVVVHGVL